MFLADNNILSVDNKIKCYFFHFLEDILRSKPIVMQGMGAEYSFLEGTRN
jgi:hypothetical protein